MTLTASVPLTDRASMERLFSAAGVVAFSDHDEAGAVDEDVVNDAIDDASEELIAAVHNRYSAESLATSRLVYRWATMLACYYLCLRRGNDFPQSWQMELERIRAELAKIEAGKALPGVALRADLRPSFSNLCVDRRWPRSKVRVVRQTSTMAPSTQPTKQADQIVVYDG